MTVSTTTSSVGPYACNGSTTEFPVTFPFLENDDLVVYLIDSDGDSTTLTLDTHYTVTGSGGASGTVTTVATYASGNTILIDRVVDLLQETDLENQATYYPEVLEDALDKLTMISQQLNSGVSRAIKFPTSDMPITDPVLPSRDDRLGKFLLFDPITGQPTVTTQTIAVADYTGMAFETIADLILTDPTSLSAGQVAIVAGYYAAGDGGGGPLRVWATAGAPYTDNGGSVIVPTAGDGSGAWVWEWDGPVNVEWFGAKGDGSTDDTTAIQAAMALGRMVVFTSPSGYKITAALTITNGSWLRGENKSSGTFITQYGGGIPAIKSATKTVTAITNVKIENLSIYNSSTAKLAGSIGVDLTDISHAVIDKCRFRYHESGIAMAGSLAGYYNFIYDCEIASNTNGIKFGTAGNSNRIIGGRIHGNYVGVNINNVNDVYIDSSIENNEFGITIGDNTIGVVYKGRFEGNGDVLGTSTRNPLAGAVVIESGATGITDLGAYYSGESDKVVDKSRRLLSLGGFNSGAVDSGAQGGNLIANATMTNNTGGITDGWVLSTGTAPAGTTYSGATVAKETGTRSQKIEVASATTVSEIRTSFNVAIGVPITVSARVQTNTDDGWRMIVGRTAGGTEYRNAIIRDTDSWATYSATFIPTTAVVYVGFSMQSATASAVGSTLNIDSVCATAGLTAGIPGENAAVIVPKVSTAGRPANPQIGTEVFDLTLTKPVWYTGTVWVDATGATV